MTSTAASRILLSEGSTLSARQTITVLGHGGHRVDVCDPDPRCLGSFSRYTRRVLRCPALGEDPAGYLAFVLDRLEREPYDVLLPVHEQAYLFARFQDRLPARVGRALAPFAAFERVQSKAAFSDLLAELGLFQPPTRTVHAAAEFVRACPLPAYVKTAFGTASGGVRRVRTTAERDAAVAWLDAGDAWREGVLIQEPAPGSLERSQALFDHGRLVAWHGYRQEVAGPGGGDVVKVSCPRPEIEAHLRRLGEALRWHGPFSLDYLWQEPDARPLYIDANPRLVEPVNAWLSGVDLPGLWLRLARGEAVAAVPAGRPGVRTRMGVMGLIQRAATDRRRRSLLGELWRLLRATGPYADTTEELTPILEDPWSALPLALVLGHLLLDPRRVGRITSRATSRHTLSLATVRFIRRQA